MRLALTLIIFIMASVTIAGGLLTLALSAPSLGLDKMDTFGWVALAGFAAALPISYIVSGLIQSKVKSGNTRSA